MSMTSLSRTMVKISLESNRRYFTSHRTLRLQKGILSASSRPLHLLQRPTPWRVTGVWSQRGFSTNDEFGYIQEIDPMTLDAKRNGKGDGLNYLIIDVREESEVEMDGNLGEDKTDWIHIPLSVIQGISDKEELMELLEKKGIEDIDEIQDYYFLCRAGRRSMTAADHILELDVDQTLFNISGGITRYQNDVDL